MSRLSLHGRFVGVNRVKGGFYGTILGNDGAIFNALKKTTITSAQVLALFATPREIIPAPGAGLAIIPRRIGVYKAAGTAYAGIAAGEDLVAKYTNAAGAQCSGVVETTGFLDQATAQARWVGPPGSTGSTVADLNPVANAAIVLHLLTAEIITGTSDLIVWSYYDVVPTVLDVAGF